MRNQYPYIENKKDILIFVLLGMAVFLLAEFALIIGI